MQLILALKSGISQQKLFIALLRLTLDTSQTRSHNLLPILTRGTPKQQHERLREHLEVVVPIDGALRVELDVAKHLHTDDGVDEEEHSDEQTDVGKRLERLDKRPEEYSDGVALTEKLYETGRAEETQETQVDCRLLVYVRVRVVGVGVWALCFCFYVPLEVAEFGEDYVCYRADHCYEVEYVPRVSEVVLL